MKKYKWNSPYEWLNEKIINANEIELRSICFELLLGVDADTIQEKFQSDMEEDGYFKEHICGNLNTDGYVIYKLNSDVVEIEDENCIETFPWDERFYNGLIYDEYKGWLFTDGKSIVPETDENGLVIKK